jgi:hypothetical protein
VMQQLVGRADKKGQVAKFTARRASAHRCGLQAGLIEANVRSGYKWPRLEENKPNENCPSGFAAVWKQLGASRDE